MTCLDVIVPDPSAGPPRRPTWPWLVVAALISVQALQIATQSYGRPGFGVDFELLYSVARVWSDGGNPYDDDAIKAAWAKCGDPSLPAPGWPVTPNVYPLTVAPLVWPLTKLPFGAAIILWCGIVLACEAWLLLFVFRSAAAAGSRPRVIPVAGVAAILMLSYPTRLNLASLNIGMIAGMLGLYSVLNARRPWSAGLALGLSLVKYSVTGPLLLLLLWRRAYRTVGVALAVQLVLVAVATWGGGSRHPLAWIDGMRAEIAASLLPGAINAHDAVRGGAMHLGVRSLWHQLAPGADAWHWFVVAALVTIGAALVLGSARHVRAPPGGYDLTLCAVWAITLTAFYHRAYDLIPVMALTAGWLVRPRTPGRRPDAAECLLWAALIWTVVPGLWNGWDAATAPPWVRLAVQPACAWAALVFAISLSRTADRSSERRASVGSDATPMMSTAPS